jgi:hypothetical protein
MRTRLALWLAAAACAGAAFWISNGVAPWDNDRANVWHHYEYLAEGFLHGHTYLSVDPAPQLLALPDPYDPAHNKAWRLWDASLYNGKFYLYFGPTPALFMLPWRIITGAEPHQRLVAGFFAALGVAALACLLSSMRSRLFPKLSDRAVAGILVTAFFASWLPVTLRRSGVWDLPIVAATACAWWALYFLWKFHDSGGMTRWAGAAGAALALLMGSRATFVPASVAIALLLLVPTTPGQGGLRRNWRAILVGAGTAAAGGLALLAYNHARFGSFREFGLSYVLFGEDYRGTSYSSPRFFPFGAWTYIFSVPRFGPYFPFIHPFWSDDRPQGYVGFEEVYGILYMMPVHLMGLIAIAWALASRGVAGVRAAGATLAGAVFMSAFAAVILFCWAWACSRYMNELLSGWTVASAVGLMSIFGSERPRAGTLMRILAVASSFWSIAFVCLASAEFRGFMAQTNPRTYAAVAHLLNYPSLWEARSEGVRFGPVDLVVRVPAGPAGMETVLLANGRPQSVNQLVLERVDGAHVRLVLAENEHRVLATPDIEVANGRIDLQLAAPWLYPPAAHPFWDGMDPALRRDRQTLFSLGWTGGSVYVHSEHSADPVGFTPVVRGSDPASPGLPYIESMAVAAHRQ